MSSTLTALTRRSLEAFESFFHGWGAVNYRLPSVSTEESHTSKVDHLALEELCHHANGKYLGERKPEVAGSNRPVGLFKSSVGGKILNADCNGAIGLMRKVGGITDGQLVAMSERKDIVRPERVLLRPMEDKQNLKNALGLSGLSGIQQVQVHL